MKVNVINKSLNLELELFGKKARNDGTDWYNGKYLSILGIVLVVLNILQCLSYFTEVFVLVSMVQTKYL